MKAGMMVLRLLKKKMFVVMFIWCNEVRGEFENLKSYIRFILVNQH